MIYWIFGQTGAGKTTHAKKLLRPNDIFIDADQIRTVWTDLRWSKEDRWEQNLRVARLAKLFHEQGHDIVIAVILPYEKLRKEVKKILGNDLTMIFVDHNEFPNDPDRPFEYPVDPEPDIIVYRKEG